LNVKISISDTTPIYEQLKNQIKKAIFLGELKSGDMLPSIRQLAKSLKISVITTKRAYDDLEAEHFIISKQGKGSYVSEQIIEFIKEKRKALIEEKITELINECKTYSMEKSELINMIDLLF